MKLEKQEKPLFDELDVETKVTKVRFEADKKLYLANAVLKLDREKTTLQGKVLENEKTFYPEISVKFNRFAATCTCGLDDEPLCPHTVALALAHIHGLHAKIEKDARATDSTYIEQFLYRIRDMFSAEAIETDLIPGFMLEINTETEMYSLFLYNKKNNSIIAQPEAVYHQIINSPYLTRIEKSLIQYFVQKEYWAFFSPLNYYPIRKGLADILTLFSEVTYVNPRTMQNHSISNTPLKLQFTMSFSEPSLKVQSHFVYKGSTIPFEETLYIEGIKYYIYWNTIFFPVWDDVYKEFLPLLTRNPNLFLTGDQIPIFLGEVLPAIPHDHFSFMKDEKLDTINVVSLKPVTEIALSEINGKLQIRLLFHYQETSIQDSLLSANKYYYLFKDGIHTYIKKDPSAEKQAENILLGNGFKKRDTDYEANEPEALEFLFTVIPALPESYTVTGMEDLEKYRINETGISFVLLMQKNNNTLLISPQYKHNNKEMPSSRIDLLFSKNNRFFQLADKTFARLPIETVHRFEDLLVRIPHQKKGSQLVIKDIYTGLIISEFNESLVYEGQTAAFVEETIQLKQLDYHAPPPRLTAQLRRYQLEGYNWLMYLQRNNWGGVLADDMGLGKTLQTLAMLMQAYSTGHVPPSLIIVPTSVLFNWEREAQRFTPDLKILKYYGIDRYNLIKEFGKYNLIFTSYGTVRRDVELLKKTTFFYIILDEAQNIKNPASQTAQTVKGLNSNHKLALTGTPIENNLTELWSLFDYVIPGLLGTTADFQRQYELFTDNEQVGILKELRAKINPYILRRTKNEVALELPAKIEDYLFCQMNDDFEKAYKHLRLMLRNDLFSKIEKDGIGRHRMDVFTAMLRLRQFCCHPRLVKGAAVQMTRTSPKFEIFKSMIEEICAEDHKILVFSQFTEMLHIIRQWLVEEDINHEYLDGTTRNRAQTVDSFNNDPEKKVFLISLKAGGTGLNLTSADYVIHYDPWWNPAVEAQATDRAHRIGQTRNVFSYKFVTKDSIEEKIIALQEKKLELYQTLLSGQEKKLSSLTHDDVEYLLS